MDQGAFTPGRSKKDKRLFLIATLFFAWHILPAIVAAGFSVTLLMEPTTDASPFSFALFRYCVMAYLISCPGVLLWGCIAPWLFHKQGSEIRIKHHLFIVFFYCLPLLFTLNAAFLRIFLSM